MSAPSTPWAGAAEVSALREDLELHRAELTQQNESLRATERHLAQALRRYETLFRAAPVGYVVVDGVTSIMRANAASCALLGAPVTTVEGSRLASWVLRRDRHLLERILLAAWTRDASEGVDVELLRADGATVLIHLRAAPWVELDAPRQCMVTIFDVQERVRAERALAESERRYRARFDGAADGLLVVDREGLVRDLNASARRLLGAAADGALGRPLAAVLDPSGSEAFRARVARVPWAPLETFDHTLRGELTLEVRARPIDEGLGEAEVVLRDVTRARRDAAERDALRRECEDASRLRAVGRLAGGVAHDVNNALAAISGVAEAMIAEGASGAEDDLRLIAQAAARARDVTRSLLGFARRSQGVRAHFDLNEVVREAGDLFRRSAPPGVRVTTTLSQQPLVVDGERSEVAQALANACSNALDALGGRGTLALVVSRGASSEGRGTARVSVVDDGCGVPAHVLPHVFEPFFSTKLDAGGTGLGLPHVWGVAQRHGGTARLDSTPGAGASLTLELPIAADPPPATRPLLPLPLRRLRLLLVDDDPLPLEATRRLLAVSGYDVTPYLQAAEVLAALSEGPLPDVLVADVRMPEISGLELLARVRARWPALPVVLVSGEAREDVFEAVARDPLARFVSKPYGRAELDGALRALCDAANAARTAVA